MPEFSANDMEKASGTPIDWRAEPVIDWLLNEGRLLPSVDDVTHQLGVQLLAAGAPLWRLRLSMRTLHPLVAASTAAWERDNSFMQPIVSTHGVQSRPEFVGSPFEAIINTRDVFRRKLEDTLADSDHAVLHEIKAVGGTEYYGLPLLFTEEDMAILTYTTDIQGGFSDSDIVKFHKVASVLAPIAEVYAAKRVAHAIAQAYLGSRTGKRVLDGQITRGDIEQINAAVLMSDIRDWTGLNTRVSSKQALAIANRYFEVIADAVEANGGEVLKFIGDGVLAVFPLPKDSVESSGVCLQALTAATQAVRAAKQLNPPLELEFGVGIHFGEVLYGNIGSKTRIDFTLMGQAVNTTARIESLCGKFNEAILFSEEFAQQLPGSVVLVAEEKLKGYDKRFKVLTIR